VGTLLLYEQNTTSVAYTFDWSRTETTGTWTIYNGVQDDDQVAGIMTWIDNQDGSEQWTFISPENSKVELLLENGGPSGWFKAYGWNQDAEDWWIQTDIIWEIDTSGSWTTYDEDGEVVDEQTW
jgi:hypothetical protein